jgi:hypothetical protein
MALVTDEDSLKVGSEMELREVDERVKLQFDYGWKWFDSCAKARMTMFYYYLIIVGILANALVLSYKEGYSAITVGIAFMGVLTSFGFMCSEIRNRGTIGIGEDVLEKLENDVIFPDDFVDDAGNKLGLLTVERKKGMRHGQRRSFKANLLKHTYWILLIQAAFALCFLLAITMAIFRPAWGRKPREFKALENRIEKIELRAKDLGSHLEVTSSPEEQRTRDGP